MLHNLASTDIWNSDFTRAQDPGIKDMAEQIANDPSFAQMTQALQTSMAGMATPDGNGGAANGAGPPAFDSTKYMEAMGGVLQNPQFMQMAEQLGQQIMNVSDAD